MLLFHIRVVGARVECSLNSFVVLSQALIKFFFFQNTFVSLGHCLISSGLRVILLKLLSMPSLRRVWRGYSLDSLYRRGKTIVEWCSCQSFSGHLWMYLDKVLFSLFFKIRFYCCTFFLQINV